MKHFSLKESEDRPPIKNGYDVKQVLRKKGYSSLSKLASTLQGMIVDIIGYIVSVWYTTHCIAPYYPYLCLLSA